MIDEENLKVKTDKTNLTIMQRAASNLDLEQVDHVSIEIPEEAISGQAHKETSRKDQEHSDRSQHSELSLNDKTAELTY